MRCKSIALMIILVFIAVRPSVAHSQEDSGPAEVAAAAIDFRYEILGNPIVGQPVAVNLFVSSSQSAAITLDYKILDTSSLSFPESQALQVEITPAADSVSARQQITVVPQREGRLYLNVSGTIDTDSGTMIRATAIPIQVSAAPRSSDPADVTPTDDL